MASEVGLQTVNDHFVCVGLASLIRRLNMARYPLLSIDIS